MKKLISCKNVIFRSFRLSLFAFFGLATISSESSFARTSNILEISEDKFNRLPNGNYLLDVYLKANASIAPQDVRVVIDFYEMGQGGKIVHSDAKILSKWVTAPVDWAFKGSETMAITYPGPADARNSYYGYVLGVYYKGQLLGSRSTPSNLIEQFPLK